MTPTDIKTLEDKDSDFAYQVDFYNSPRTCSNSHYDVVSASLMTAEELLDPDLGQGISKIKVLRMLDAAGIKGNFSWERKEKRYYKKIKIEFFKRTVVPIVTPLILFEDVYKLEQKREKPWKMLEKMRKKEGTSLGSYP